MDLDPNDIDKVLKLFNFHNHLCKNFRETVSKIIPEFSDQSKMLHYLTEQSILEPWKNNRDNYILTKNGRDIVETYENYAQYLENEKSLKEEAVKINAARNETILNNAKLSRFQVKSFWYILIFAAIGGVYSTLSITNLIFGESTEKKIERIIDTKMQLQDNKHKASSFQTGRDTINR